MTLVLFSGGLNSAVVLSYLGQAGPVTPVHVRCGYAWEHAEASCIRRLMRSAIAPRVMPLQSIKVDMRDLLPDGHWAITGIAPLEGGGDHEAFLQGRNIILLSKAALLAAQLGIGKVALGLLKGTVTPDATPMFLSTMGRAMTLGLARDIQIQTPFASWSKGDIVREAVRVGLPFDLTISCVAPMGGRHCGRCAKCRERHLGFEEALVNDPTDYVDRAEVDRLPGPGSSKPS